MKDDKGTLDVEFVLKFVRMGLKAIPGVSEQGEKGMEKMLVGALMLADDLSDEVDEFIDVDGDEE